MADFNSYKVTNKFKIDKEILAQTAVLSELNENYDSCKRKQADDNVKECCVERVNENTFKRKVTSRSANLLFLLLRTNTMKCLVQKILLIGFFVSTVSGKEQRFAIEPQDQSAVVGSRVILPCRVENKAGQLQWTKDDFGLGTHRHLTGYERYKMVGSDEEGDYSLDIREVALEDDAVYQCQVSSGARGEPAIRSRYAKLLVLTAPDPPEILQGSTIQTVEDKEVDLECLSMAGKPAAEITWVDNDGSVLTNGVTYTIEPMSDGRRFTARSILRLRPRRHHHNQTFTCQAQNTADRAYRTATIRLLVQYAPIVKVIMKSGGSRGYIQEGDTLIMGCQAEGIPNDMTYKWFLNNDQIFGTQNDEIVISNVTRKHNEGIVKCEVQNTVGKSANTKTLEVLYGPVFKVRPRNVEGEIGSSVTLSCIVEGHPQPKIIWLRYENERVIRVGKTPNLTVTVTQHSAGQYWCRAVADGRQEVESAAVVYLKGPPRILSNQTQLGVEGDMVRLECLSFSVPKPEYIIWSYKGNEINTFYNQEFAFLEETLSDGITKSTLIIRESETKHFGDYNCSVTNVYGTDSVEITLMPDKSFPLIFTISSCATASVCFLLILLIVMLCHQKSRKSEEKKPDITVVGKTCDQIKDSDRCSNMSDLKMELRHIEGSCEKENSKMDAESDYKASLHLTTNLGLPLAGPVPVTDNAKYHRYSGDFHQAISNLHFKMPNQTNGYVAYVDYSRDYAPPQSDTASLSRSTDGANFHGIGRSLQRQASCGRLGVIGPDVIPMNPGVMMPGVDVRFAATYGNPYLRGSGNLTYSPQSLTSINGTPAPPPYYTTKKPSIPVPSMAPSPSSSSSHKSVMSPGMSTSLIQNGAQPQVPNTPPKSSGSLYVLPTSSQTNLITVKGNNGKGKPGTHV